MRCPKCGSLETRVIETRTADEGRVVRRRRECPDCTARFTTYEKAELRRALRVIKKDGRREAFDRSKILTGIKKACEKRPVSIDAIEAVVDRIERACQESQLKEVPSTFVGERVMQELHDLDKVAYVRFASVYRQFRDANEFFDELKDLLKTK